MGRTGAVRVGRVGRDPPGAAAARRLIDDARCDAAAWATLAARESYGKLLAILASRRRDVAAAEDALADAFPAGVASRRRLAELRPDLPFTLIDNAKACPELGRPAAVIIFIRADI